MSRSYRKPVCKLENDGGFKKIYNRKIRRNKIILHTKGEFRKLNCSWDICDFNTGELSSEEVKEQYGGREYKIRRK